MVLTPSHMLPLGTHAPDFTLWNVISQKQASLKELKSPIATVIMFICNHCPYVKHLQTQLVRVARDYQAKNIAFIAINSNDAEHYPADNPEKMRETAEQFGYPFPYLFDETQEVAKAYHAACTPDFYIFNKDLACVYRGQFDNSRPGNGIDVTGESLTHALDCVLEGKEIPADQQPSVGCNIKWKG